MRLLALLAIAAVLYGIDYAIDGSQPAVPCSATVTLAAGQVV